MKVVSFPELTALPGRYRVRPSRERAVGLVYPHFGWLRELLIALKLSNQFMDVAKATEL